MVTSLSSSGARSALRARPVFAPPRQRIHSTRVVTVRAAVSRPGTRRAPTSSVVALRCGHRASGCRRAPVALKGVHGPLPTRALAALPVSQAREPKARAAPRLPKRRYRSASDPVVVDGALVRGEGKTIPGGCERAGRGALGSRLLHGGVLSPEWEVEEMPQRARPTGRDVADTGAVAVVAGPEAVCACPVALSERARAACCRSAPLPASGAWTPGASAGSPRVGRTAPYRRAGSTTSSVQSTTWSWTRATSVSTMRR